jgi:hypothetical protein
MAADDGWVVSFEVYMDESYEERKSDVLCIAGYVFRTLRAREFAKEWQPYLRRKGLPYFHMSECAHAQGVFKGRTDCDEIARKLIGLTRRKAEFAFAVTVDQAAYRQLLEGTFKLQSCYSFALFEAMVAVRVWMENNNHYQPVSYFFEQGHHSKADADRFMNWVFESESIRQKYRYRNHAFLPKETPWLHPADFLAWSWRLEAGRQRQESRRPPRKDLLAMIRPGDMHIDYNAENLPGLRAALERRAIEKIRASISGQLLAAGGAP